MANRLEVLIVSKKHNLLRNLRLPMVLIYIVAGFLVTATISTIVLFVNSTRRTFVRMHLTKVERENRNLVAKLDSINIFLKKSQNFFDDQHISQDNRERTYWQMAHIHPDIWSMGIGGKQNEYRPQITNGHTEAIINEIYESVDVLKGKYYLRQTSLKDIQSQIEDNLYLWSHTPQNPNFPARSSRAYITMKNTRSRSTCFESTTRRSLRRFCRKPTITVRPPTNMASVESMNGAPRMAPSPIFSPSSALPRKMAMMVMMVSGIAVPTAARMLPVAHSEMPRRRPSHSMPLTNISQLNSMTRREPMSMATFEISGAKSAPASSCTACQ